jgi:hypothetical protein
MFGRIAGLVVGLLVLASGFGLWKPATAARYEHFLDFARLPLAGFDQYRTLVAWLIMALGAAICVAAVQREADKPKSARIGVTLLSGDEEPVATHQVYADEAEPQAQEAFVEADGAAHAHEAEQAHAPAH